TAWRRGPPTPARQGPRPSPSQRPSLKSLCASPPVAGERRMPIHGDAAVSYGNDRLQTLGRPVPWIWDGLVAEDAVTLLSAPEKPGKTTLLSLLLDRRRQGGQLLGRTVRPGRPILCSEENPIVWALRQPPLDFGPQLEYHRPIGG